MHIYIVLLIKPVNWWTSQSLPHAKLLCKKIQTLCLVVLRPVCVSVSPGNVTSEKTLKFMRLPVFAKRLVWPKSSSVKKNWLIKFGCGRCTDNTSISCCSMVIIHCCFQIFLHIKTAWKHWAFNMFSLETAVKPFKYTASSNKQLCLWVLRQLLTSFNHVTIVLFFFIITLSHWLLIHRFCHVAICCLCVEANNSLKFAV